jgi:hypothetical protein
MKNQLEITIDTRVIDSLSGSAPLFHRTYDGDQCSAFLLLDEDGNVSIDIRAPWGMNSFPIDEWHGRTQCWEISSAVHRDALRGAFSDTYILELLQRVHNGHSVEWNGNNYVGVLNEDAEEASDELEQCFDDLATWDVRSAYDWLAEEYIDANLWPAGTTVQQVVADLKAEARDRNVLIAEGTKGISDMLCEILLEQLKTDDTFTLTAEQREALLRNHASRLGDIEVERDEVFW